MKIRYRALVDCDGVEGCVAVIDVLRALATAARAFESDELIMRSVSI